MTFFERFFGALDGPDPASSLGFVADDLRFAIFWTAGAGRESEQHLGGKEELRQFVEAGGVSSWTHRITHTARVDGVSPVNTTSHGTAPHTQSAEPPREPMEALLRGLVADFQQLADEWGNT